LLLQLLSITLSLFLSQQKKNMGICLMQGVAYAFIAFAACGLLVLAIVKLRGFDTRQPNLQHARAVDGPTRQVPAKNENFLQFEINTQTGVVAIGEDAQNGEYQPQETWELPNTRFKRQSELRAQDDATKQLIHTRTGAFRVIPQVQTQSACVKAGFDNPYTHAVAYHKDTQQCVLSTIPARLLASQAWQNNIYAPGTPFAADEQTTTVMLFRQPTLIPQTHCDCHTACALRQLTPASWQGHRGVCVGTMVHGRYDHRCTAQVQGPCVCAEDPTQQAIATRNSITATSLTQSCPVRVPNMQTVDYDWHH
jgi:hypothetical protein